MVWQATYPNDTSGYYDTLMTAALELYGAAVAVPGRSALQTLYLKPWQAFCTCQAVSSGACCAGPSQPLQLVRAQVWHAVLPAGHQSC